MIDGCSKVAGRSCENALRQLRGADFFQCYWINAICIDQENDEERSQQVEAMPVIFASALLVAISYGVDSDAVSSLMTEVVCAHSDQRNVFYGSEHYDIPAASSTPLRDASQRRDGIVELSTRAYWGRLWIVQESSLARSLVALSETRGVDMPTLYRLCGDTWGRSKLDAMAERLPSSSLFTLPMMKLGHDLNGYCPGPSRFTAKIPFHDALSRFGDRKCKDARDRIYAISSLIPWPSERPRIRADYSITSAELPLQVLDLVGTQSDTDHCNRYSSNEPWSFICLLPECLGVDVSQPAVLQMVRDRQDEYRQGPSYGTSPGARHADDSTDLDDLLAVSPSEISLLTPYEQYETCTLQGRQGLRDLWIQPESASRLFHKTGGDAHFAHLASVDGIWTNGSTTQEGTTLRPRILLDSSKAFLGLLPSAAQQGDAVIQFPSHTLDSHFKSYLVLRDCGHVYSMAGIALLVPEATLSLQLRDHLGRRRPPLATPHRSATRRAFAIHFDYKDALVLACLLQKHKHLIIPRQTSMPGVWSIRLWSTYTAQHLGPLSTAICKYPFSLYVTLQSPVTVETDIGKSS